MVKESYSPEETFAIGKEIGEQLKPGDVYCLIGDLGVGKTVFTQGVAAGLGITEPVNSPTFTIVNVYKGENLILNHFDAYRIGDSDEMLDIGFDEMITGDAVSVIEWAELIEDILPKERYNITINNTGDNSRKITIEKK